MLRAPLLANLSDRPADNCRPISCIVAAEPSPMIPWRETSRKLSIPWGWERTGLHRIVAGASKGALWYTGRPPENHPMVKKHKAIPAVPFDVIIKGHEAVHEDAEKYGAGDPAVSLVRVFHKSQRPDVIIAASYRLGALAKLLREGHAAPWTYAVTNANYHMINEVMFRAAARAPLFEAKTVGEVSFDRAAFMQIVLEESEADGTA